MLALDLVRSWSFERPSLDTFQRHTEESDATSPKLTQPPSPIISRRPMYSLEPSLRRRSSIKIDMEILSLPPTRSASPEHNSSDKNDKKTTATSPVIKHENDLLARKARLGNLMKTAKQDVQVPEFDMNAFF